MTDIDCDLDNYLNNFLPKLFYEIECDKQEVTVRVPGSVKDRVYRLTSSLCVFCSCRYRDREESKKNGNV